VASREHGFRHGGLIFPESRASSASRHDEQHNRFSRTYSIP
jgi:hypothetical protein